MKPVVSSVAKQTWFDLDMKWMWDQQIKGTEVQPDKQTGAKPNPYSRLHQIFHDLALRKQLCLVNVEPEVQSDLTQGAIQ
jgi:hypothetical protein